MLLIFFRTIFLYLIVLIVMRLMGKREIGQLQPFELVISIMIANLATIPMSDTGIPILNGIIPVLGLLFMHICISLINLKSIKARGIICGRPSILINKGRIEEKILRKERFTINELEERLRGQSIDHLSDVEYAILETSGQISVIKKNNNYNNNNKEKECIDYDLVIDGVIMKENLKKLNKDYNWLVSLLQPYGLLPEEALIVTINEENKLFYQKKEGC